MIRILWFRLSAQRQISAAAARDRTRRRRLQIFVRPSADRCPNFFDGSKTSISMNHAVTIAANNSEIVQRRDSRLLAISERLKVVHFRKLFTEHPIACAEVEGAAWNFAHKLPGRTQDGAELRSPETLFTMTMPSERSPKSAFKRGLRD